MYFPGLFPIPRFHEDEFHEDKFTTPQPLPPLYPLNEGDRVRRILYAIHRITRLIKMKMSKRKFF